MTTYNPVYRLTVYADEAMTTVLTPASGAPHSDDFKVATDSGITGFKPYLDFPQGRKGRFDYLSRKLDTGRLRVRLLDKRTTEGGTNLERWITAFVGDADGEPNLAGRMARFEFRETSSDSWADYFTGRLYRPRTSGRVWWDLEVRDLSTDLRRTIFLGRPHTSVSYATTPALIPFGLTGGYGGTTAADPLPAIKKKSDTLAT